MKTEIAVALIAGAVSLASAGVAFVSSWQTSVNSRAIEQLKIENNKAEVAAQRQREVSKFSEPLARSAYDLQSRIYNIIKRDFMVVYLTKGKERQRTYAVNNTVYVLAQYFCYVELARTELKFIDLGENKKTLDFQTLQDNISKIWLEDHYPPPLMIFAGEQRAVGEALIVEHNGVKDCMGYGEFLKIFTPGSNSLIDALREDIETMKDGTGEVHVRLVEAQHALIDLLKLLDPNHIRFPEEYRSKI